MRHASGPGHTTPPVGRALRTHAEASGVGVAAAGRERTMSTPTSAASSSGVGVPRTTRNVGSASDITREYDVTATGVLLVIEKR